MNSNNNLPMFTNNSTSTGYTLQQMEEDYGFNDDDTFALSTNVEYHPSFELTTHPDEHDLYDDEQSSTVYRDAPHIFSSNGPTDLFQADTGFFETNLFENTGKTPVFVLESATSHLESTYSKLPVTSPLSPSSSLTTIDVPFKTSSYFCSVSPHFTSSEAPTTIMEVMKKALETMDCQYDTVQLYTLHASCLMVAEEVQFSVNLFQFSDKVGQYQVEFNYHQGDQLYFNNLVECLRAHCASIDDDSGLSMFYTTLEPWMDANQSLTGRRYMIKENEALSLVEELNCSHLHIDTLYEVAKSIKNHCRHKHNRQLFITLAREQFVRGLQWMLEDSEPLQRFALFILLQFAQDSELMHQLFTTPYEQSAVKLSLNQLNQQQSNNNTKVNYTQMLLSQVMQSPLLV